MYCCICGIYFNHHTEYYYGICETCSEGSKSTITLTNKFEGEKGSSSSSSSISAKGFADALKRMKEMKEMKEEQNEKMSYFSEFAVVFKDQIHTDIKVQPGNNEPSIPAHKAVLAARSSVFRNILDSDECKAPPDHTITLPELSHDELRSLLEFLYSGNLPREIMERYAHRLFVASDKYDIPFLQKFCVDYILESLSTSNALDVLELLNTCSNETLKDAALSFVVRNMEDVVFSERSDAFARNSPHLTMKIMRKKG